MDLVAGPQGGGKSNAFRVQERGFGDAYNVDDARKALNGGSSQNIPRAVKDQVTAEYTAFIEDHIASLESFSIEVTLAREITFDQALRAQRRGFTVQMTYVASEVDECVRRVRARAQAGGHGLPEPDHRRIYAASMANLSRALAAFDIVQVHASVRATLGVQLFHALPRLVLETLSGDVVFRSPDPPHWLTTALQGTRYAF